MSVNIVSIIDPYVVNIINIIATTFAAFAAFAAFVADIDATDVSTSITTIVDRPLLHRGSFPPQHHGGFLPRSAGIGGLRSKSLKIASNYSQIPVLVSDQIPKSDSRPKPVHIPAPVVIAPYLSRVVLNPVTQDKDNCSCTFYPARACCETCEGYIFKTGSFCTNCLQYIPDDLMKIIKDEELERLSAEIEDDQDLEEVDEELFKFLSDLVSK
jgi:hypothetical protein